MHAHMQRPTAISCRQRNHPGQTESNQARICDNQYWPLTQLFMALARRGRQPIHLTRLGTCRSPSHHLGSGRPRLRTRQHTDRLGRAPPHVTRSVPARSSPFLGLSPGQMSRRMRMQPREYGHAHRWAHVSVLYRPSYNEYNMSQARPGRNTSHRVSTASQEHRVNQLYHLVG